MTGIDLPKALDAIPVVANATDRDARYPTPATNQRVFRLDTSNVELYNGTSWTIVIVGQNTTEGSWTPAMVGGTIPGTFTYSTQIGRYIKNGNLVTAWCYLVASATSVSATGTVTLTGLPYAGSNVAGLYQAVTIGEVDGITLGGSFSDLSAYVAPNASSVTIRKIGSNVSAALLQGSDLASAWGLMLTLTYRTN